ncbi:hypothetical protein G6O69_11130 [Pseudenhygromyxa sp. WMMC2535]|uniref:hypothetical protein n=1 Tax=Pseudenhygromyxa sp. WMMC2535 TaxID=2712867 RepID=UPI001552B86D|nr:hypothetical protein [Pseudenhygromyxa sp. WMMC2535]NVB38384.1 hypothetical protein [Pseudenhygromyxa sp. WMMC2535]
MSEFNPYQAPSGDQAPAAKPLQDAGKPLFGLKQITVVAFLASGFAGCVLLAINAKRMGRKRIERVGMVLLGILITLTAVGLGFVLPEEIPNVLLSGAVAGLVYKVAEVVQGTELSMRLVEGRPQASNWAAFGIGAACLVGIVALAFALAFLVVTLAVSVFGLDPAVFDELAQ